VATEKPRSPPIATTAFHTAPWPTKAPAMATSASAAFSRRPERAACAGPAATCGGDFGKDVAQSPAARAANTASPTKIAAGPTLGSSRGTAR